MFIFAGERPSQTAIDKKWSWVDGRLAAKQLFDALDYSGVDRKQCLFVNIFYGKSGWKINRKAVRYIANSGMKIVGMGLNVQKVLSSLGMEFIGITHPAARGRIRKKSVYADHIKSKLATIVEPIG